MKKRRLLIINTPEELRKQLGLPKGVLEKLQSDVEHRYTKNGFIDKKGKLRKIYRPNKELDGVLKRIDRRLLSRINYPDAFQGGIPERSITTNAGKHVGRRYVANFDIKNFFPSIDFHVVYEAFRSQKCSPEVARTLTRLTTADGALPQGYRTSPKVSTLVLFEINRRLENLFGRYGLEHSFWIDDLTVSGNHPIEELKKLIYKIFQQGGFKLNDPKTVIAGKARRQKVTGLVVNQKVNVGKELERKIRQEIFFIQKFGLRSHLLKIGVAVPPKQYLASLKGRAAFLENINPKNKKYRESLEEVRDEAGPGLN